MNHVPTPVHPAILRYARGEIGMSRAVDALGPGATKHDVIAQMREAGNGPPRPPREVELAQLEQARRMLGIPTPPGR